MKTTISPLKITAYIFLLCTTLLTTNTLAAEIFQTSEIIYTMENSGSTGGIYPESDLEPATIGDGDVDGADLALFSNYLDNSDPQADIDGDGNLDNNDTTIFSAQFGAL